MTQIMKLTDIHKVFHLERRKFRHIFKNPFKKRQEKHFWALEEISFEVEAGECIGFIGLNGSGKSTLANIIANQLAPTSGELESKGTVSLLAIGSALKPNLTGVENIQLKMLMMDFKQKEIDERIEKIIEFTELEEFIHQPIKHYSSGMRARLGFGIAIQTSPDILIIDEALSVGDSSFYQKCLDEIERMKVEGKTIFFVSHSLKQIREVCDKVAWLHYGQLKQFGASDEVCLEYSKFIHHFMKKKPLEKQAYQKEMILHQKRERPGKFKKEKQRFPVILFLFLSGFLLLSMTKMIGIW